MRKSFTLIALLATLGAAAQNNILTNYAGSGSGAYSGDGGPATLAALGTPNGATIDNAGNIYVGDAIHHLIRKIDPSGTISTIAGLGAVGYSGDGGPATAAAVCTGDLATDDAGNVYIADHTNYAIRKINTAGIITTIAGTGTTGFSGDGGPATAAQITTADGITVDRTGNVYFTQMNGRIRKIDAAGIITTIAGTGVNGFSGDGGPATAAQLYVPNGICTDPAGNVYVADLSNNRIRKINTAGIISTIAGGATSGYAGDGGMATQASLSSPSDVAINAFGDIYIVDRYNYVIRKINSAGIISTVAGNGVNGCPTFGVPATATSIDPYYLFFNSSLELFTSTPSCNHIDKISIPPSVVSDSFSVYLDNLCGGVQIGVTAQSTSPLSVRTYFGDGTSSLNTLASSSFNVEGVGFVHDYAVAGTYEMKMILLNGTAPIDSVSYSYHHLLCTTLPVQFYYDANANCVMDSAEAYNYFPVTVAVDSNGVTIDTISVTSGLSYTAYGNPGDIYSFKVLSTPGAMFASCPTGGIVSDTLKTEFYNSNTRFLGLSCSTSTAFDLGIFVHTKAGRHRFEGSIILNNAYCDAQTATFTSNISPKYNFQSASPASSTVAGNIATWDISGLSATSPQFYLHFTGEVPGAWLMPGDTVNSDYSVTPVTGDINPENNNDVKTDTVKSSYDPNEMSVMPEGYISSGTQLQYTIDFENTGNDTAHNIYVMDTLSDNVIPTSMRILASSATMNIIPIRAGGHNIIKFDFPNIYLPDSSHHNQCNGMVMFTINTRSGLPDGTLVTNGAGIFFDDNPVVLTNSVVNIVGHASLAVTTSSKSQIAVFPNPVADVLNLRADNTGYNSFTITNSIGDVITSQTIDNGQASVNTKMLPAGIYFIRFTGDAGTAVRKFVKQ